MNRSTFRILALAAAAGVSACADAGVPDTPLAPAAGPSLSADAAAADGGYLVRFTGGVPAGFADRVAALGGTVIFAHGGAGIGAVAGLSPDAAASLAALRGVSAVAADEVTVLDQPSGAGVAQVDPAQTQAGDNPAAAGWYPRQWNLRAIDAGAAWAAGRLGSPSVRVAILDTGLDYTHPDLAGRVDLAASRSFLPSQDALLQARFPGAHPVADLHLHGTHVGAIVTSNAVAAAGVTSRLTLVGLKVCDVNGRCPTSALLAGVLYAADLGVDVANLSLGSRFARSDSAASARSGPSFVAVVNDAFNYANRKGMTVVVAAGNAAADLDHDGNDFRTYCGAPTVVCVAATGPRPGSAIDGPYVDVDAPAPYSNYGRSAISVAAPGGAAVPVWAACSRFTLLVPVCRTGVFVIGLNGTSMASPHTAGAAALIVEDVGRDPAQVRTRLQRTADDLGEAGTDPRYGKGRINAARAVGAR